MSLPNIHSTKHQNHHTVTYARSFTHLMLIDERIPNIIRGGPL